jgi:hypothetical protein
MHIKDLRTLIIGCENLSLSFLFGEIKTGMVSSKKLMEGNFGNS